MTGRERARLKKKKTQGREKGERGNLRAIETAVGGPRALVCMNFHAQVHICAACHPRVQYTLGSDPR